jgi:hypothetical protein
VLDCARFASRVLGALATNRLGTTFFTPAGLASVGSCLGVKKAATESVRRAEPTGRSRGRQCFVAGRALRATNRVAALPPASYGTKRVAQT